MRRVKRERALPSPGPRHGSDAVRRTGAKTARRTGWMARAMRRIRHGGRPLAAVALVVLLTGAGFAAWRAGIIARATEGFASTFASFGAASGFLLREVTIEGRRETTEAQMKRAVAIPLGEPVLSIDLAALRERVLALPWVREARIERHLPGRIHVAIEERTPFALWQERGQFVVIDRDGRVIETVRVAAFAHLPVVVGKGAEKTAAAHLDLLAMHPRVAERTRASVRVGDRRWNLRLASGADVLLPELDPEGAIARLSELQKQNGLLDRELTSLDLRLPDRLVLAPVPAPPSPALPAQPATNVRNGGRQG